MVRPSIADLRFVWSVLRDIRGEPESTGPGHEVGRSEPTNLRSTAAYFGALRCHHAHRFAVGHPPNDDTIAVDDIVLKGCGLDAGATLKDKKPRRG